MRRRIKPVTDTIDGATKLRRVPLPLAAGGRDLPEDGAWIDDEPWVARRLRDGDITDDTKAYGERMAAAEKKAADAAKAAPPAKGA